MLASRQGVSIVNFLTGVMISSFLTGVMNFSFFTVLMIGCFLTGVMIVCLLTGMVFVSFLTGVVIASFSITLPHAITYKIPFAILVNSIRQQLRLHSRPISQEQVNCQCTV